MKILKIAWKDLKRIQLQYTILYSISIYVQCPDRRCCMHWLLTADSHLLDCGICVELLKVVPCAQYLKQRLQHQPQRSIMKISMSNVVMTKAWQVHSMYVTCSLPHRQLTACTDAGPRNLDRESKLRKKGAGSTKSSAARGGQIFYAVGSLHCQDTCA